MVIGECTIKINVEGLEALDAFMNKHGDKISFVGSFRLGKGDTLFLKSQIMLSSGAAQNIIEQFEKLLPDVKVVILEDGIDLVGKAERGKRK